MNRLNKKAFHILRVELEKCGGDNSVSKIEREIVLTRLKELRRKKGSPATTEELRDNVVDIFPEFSDKILKRAAKANQPPGMLSYLKWSAIFLTGASGLLWVVNLPYPMIRWPVAKTAPLLLLPSFISMDNNYKGSIQSLEQADQLINRATSQADIELGGKQARKAQRHLDQLPAWFLGYYPRAYCNLFSCQWKFTFDEFENARRRIARIEAKVFQEKNAFAPLQEAESALKDGKQKYKQAKNSQEREQALASIQTAIDALTEIPARTLAGKQARIKLTAHRRDFTKVSRGVAGSDRTNTVIAAAKLFAMQAAQASQNPPHSAEKWQQIAQMWSEAITRLKKVKLDNPNYLEAQKSLVTYQNNLGIVQTRRKAESESKRALQKANQQIQQLIASPPSDSNRLKGKLQGIINLLRTVQSGTTAYTESQQLLVSAQKRLQNL